MSANPQEKVTVFYHSPCLDGAAAAWAAYQKWGDAAQYIGINHDKSENIRDLIMQNIDGDTHVVFADFTPPVNHADDPPWKLMDDIADHVKQVTVYDHHHSAIGDMDGYENSKVKLVFDEERSGASIVYNELFPRKKLPQAVELAEMIDLEHASRKDFFSIAAYIDSLPISTITEAVQSFEQVNNQSMDDIIKQGQSIRRYHAISIDKTIASASWTKIQILPNTDAVYVPIINANPHHLGREFNIRLRQLAEKSAPGFVALSWFEDKGLVRVSVRTNGVPDAGKIAAHIGSSGLGGGGHSNSAAAQFTIDQFNSAFKRLRQEEVVQAITQPAEGFVIDEPEAKQVGRRRSAQGKATGK